MKERSSLRKAIWSTTREDWYREECNKILFNNQLAIKIGDNNVYLQSADDEKFLLQVSKPKAMWYEIWLQLKKI